MAGLFVSRPRLRRASRWLLALVVFCLAALALLPAGIWLGPLENRFQVPDSLPREVDGVVVVGGALSIRGSRGRPRAVGVFRRYSWPVVPYPVDFQTSGKIEWRSQPNLARGLVEVTRASKEWAGLLAYRLLGWSNSLFPHPTPDATLRPGG